MSRRLWAVSPGESGFATNEFRIASIKLVDGEPKVEWVPKMNCWTGVELNAVLKGAATLDGEWKAVEGASAAEKAAMRYASPYHMCQMWYTIASFEEQPCFRF